MHGSVSISGQLYLSVGQAAIRVGVAPRTVKRWISAGLLPATRLPSPKGLGQLRVRWSDVEVLMSRGLL
jgi:excisionase family DNA binding protein